MRLCREKIKRTRAQIELNLATAIEDNKICLNLYISNAKRVKENLHPLLDAKGNIVTTVEEKAEVLSVFFASLVVRPFVLWVSSPLSWKTRMGSRMKPPQSKRKWSATCYTT